MDMTITQLRYLVELAESANATQAAQKLNVTRPALTNGIRQLEEQLNTKLVVTHNNKITLTANGQKVVAQAKKILNDVNTLYELVGNHDRRTLRIGLLSNIQPIMERIGDYHDGQVALSFQSSQELLRSIQQQTLDLAFTVVPNDTPLDSLPVQFDPIFEDHLGAFAIPENPLVPKHVISYQELQKENIIVSHDADNERFIHQIMAKHGSLHIVLTTPGINLVHHIMDNETILLGRRSQLDWSPYKDQIKLVELSNQTLNQVKFSFGWLYLRNHHFAKSERSLIRAMTADFYQG